MFQDADKIKENATSVFSAIPTNHFQWKQRWVNCAASEVYYVAKEIKCRTDIRCSLHSIAPASKRCDQISNKLD